MPRVVIVPCLSDNYAYLVVDEATGAAAVVDPSEAGPVLDAARREGVRLGAIWCTHHHFDHVGGNEELAEALPGLRTYGHASDWGRIPGQTEALDHGGTFRLGAEEVRALHVPGHTLGAVAYWVGGVVFTGDTLFHGGCGRLFEGTPEAMHRSLSGVLGALPGSTRVYCGHEYTVANLRFARTVEPGNPDVETRLAECAALAARGQATVGATLGVERRTNPFLRTSSPEVRAFVGLGPDAPDAEVLGALRRAKDGFRG